MLQSMSIALCARSAMALICAAASDTAVRSRLNGLYIIFTFRDEMCRIPARLKSPVFHLWEAATIKYSQVKGHLTGIRSHHPYYPIRLIKSPNIVSYGDYTGMTM